MHDERPPDALRGAFVVDPPSKICDPSEAEIEIS
jgi:hypothetical protein